jgi:hypothetical protein
MFEDKGLLVLVADCDNTLVDMAGSGPDRLYAKTAATAPTST